uniref:NADH-ubiquinone oxidoreductase chain 4L n=1 Tax=Pupa strigosa TaxID=96460 RepID=Q9T9G4_9GAST|nr:NADH dehydrogenase subunit 4L [Pupa strigosa]BAA89019.1 ND4L [Pupa strigosa]
MTLMFLSVVVICSAAIGFCMFSIHILSILILLEAMMLGLLGFLYSLHLASSTLSSSWILLLTFAACEASLGLSLLVSMLRLRGNDLTSSIVSLDF